jgi:hypothetical protein
MDLYHKLDNDDEFINFFCDVLEDVISPKKGCKVNVYFKKHDMSIFFFIDGSSILNVMPDKDFEYTYANSPSYEDDVQMAINIIEKQFNREERINQIIKKES